MSSPRWLVIGTFASGFMVLALSSNGFSQAESSAPIVLVGQSSGNSGNSNTITGGKLDPLSESGDPYTKMERQSRQNSQDKDQRARSGKTGKSDAESSGKMESKDPLPGGGNTDPSSKMEEQSGGNR